MSSNWKMTCLIFVLALAWLSLATLGGQADSSILVEQLVDNNPTIVTQAEWEAYKLEWAKNYDSPAIESRARANYARNKQYIEQFNEGLNKGHTFTLRLNQFSDTIDHELAGQRSQREHLCERRGSPIQGLQRNRAAARRLFEGQLGSATKLEPIPRELDWRKVPGRVSAVRDQGDCQCGWAFAIAGMLEGQEAVRVNGSLREPIVLSPQDLIDCEDSYCKLGCSDGNIYRGLDTVATIGGIEPEAANPYAASDQRECHFDKSRSVISTKGPGYLPYDDPDNLAVMVAKYGPIAAQIDGKTPTLLHYAGGVYNDRACGSVDPSLYHAVLIVGYGTDPKGGDYWLVKNSWGPKWGEQGYVRIARNGYNICSIENKAIIAT